MSGIYVHIPFCKRKCLYCDFYSVGINLADWKSYVDAVLTEANIRKVELGKSTLRTLYLGGGTPSLLPANEFERLSNGLTSLLQERGINAWEEFTIEVNPDDVTEELADTWQRCGVTRVSMGVQSLIDSELEIVGRRHDSKSAISSYHTLRKRFSNISLDLIFGLPGQSINTLMQSVEGIIALKPEHISVYSLMYEERTALTRLRDSGKLEEIPEQDSVMMFTLLSEALAKAGYEQYEISNYALPGYRSQHNSSYWHGKPYLGLGPGAHSYDGKRRRASNLPNIKTYLDYWQPNSLMRYDKENAPHQIEILSKEELREEYIMTGLRTREGIDLQIFAQNFGESNRKELLRSARKWLVRGNLIEHCNRLQLTTSGVMISDEIISDLF